MSTAGRREGDGAAGDLAGRLRDADYVRVIVRPDGDALAAAGLLARGLAAVDVPFKTGVAATARERADRAASDGDGITVVVGQAPGTDAVHLDGDRPASLAAHEVAAELGSPAPVLGLAGCAADGLTPGEKGSASLLERAGLERRPGVAVPTADLSDGLAHATTLHAPVSGDEEAARALLSDLSLPADLDEEARRRVASAVALRATGGEAPPSAASAIEGVLRPYATPEAPFATLGGYADVLAALSEAAPGLGVAIALDRDVRADALSVWRDRAREVHDTLRTAATGRYDGLSVVRVEDAPVAPVARLYRDYRSPEPAALAIGRGEAALATGESDAAAAMEAGARAFDADLDVRATHAVARFDEAFDDAELIAAVRREL